MVNGVKYELSPHYQVLLQEAMRELAEVAHRNSKTPFLDYFIEELKLKEIEMPCKKKGKPIKKPPVKK